MKAFELRKLIAEKKEARKALVARAEGENRDMTEGEDTEFNALRTEIETLKARLAKLEDVEGEGDEEAPAEEEKSAPRSRPIAMESRKAPAVHTRKHEYSLCRLVLAQANGKRVDGLEGEWSAELALRAGKSPNGVFVPHHFGNEAAMEKRNLTLTTGSGAIPVIVEESLIDYLYNRTAVMKAGAQVISDMTNKFALPRLSGTSTAYWVGEGSAPTASNQTIDQVVFTPNTIAAYVDLSRKFIMQSVVNAEQLARNDLATVLSVALDTAAINGSGSSNQPTGILNQSGLTIVALGTDGGAPTYAQVVGLENSVAKQNADLGKLGYMTNAQGRSILKTTAKIGSTYPVFLCEDNEVNGYPLYVSQNVPANLTKGTSAGNCSAIIFGNWQDLAIAMFGATDVLVDPFTGSNSGNVRINIFQDADVQVKHIASFAATVDVTTTGF